MNCKKPVLLEKDILALFAIIPEKIVTENSHSRWTYVFAKEYPAEAEREENNFDVTFDMVFAENKLCEVAFSPRFLGILPKFYLMSMLLAMGNADVDVSNRSVKARIGGTKIDKMSFPSREDIIKCLGRPYRKSEENEVTTLYYQYHAKASSKEGTCTRLVTAELMYSKGSGLPLRSVVNIAGFKADIQYDLIRRALQTPTTVPSQ